MLNWCLFGALSVQICAYQCNQVDFHVDKPADWYYLAFPKDTRLIKALVTTVYLAEAVQTVLITHDCFQLFARHFGDPSNLNLVQLEWFATPTLTAIGPSLFNHLL